MVCRQEEFVKFCLFADLKDGGLLINILLTSDFKILENFSGYFRISKLRIL